MGTFPRQLVMKFQVNWSERMNQRLDDADCLNREIYDSYYRK